MSLGNISVKYGKISKLTKIHFGRLLLSRAPRRLLPASVHVYHFFSARHGMLARTSDEKDVCESVRPSVCLSDKRVNCDKTEERSVQIFILYERSFSLVF